MKTAVPQRKVEWKVIAVAAAAYILSLAIVNALASQESPLGGKLRELHAATGGLIEPTLVGSLLVLLVFGSVVFVVGRVSLTDVGWDRRSLGPALLTVVGFWALMQGALAVITITQESRVWLHPSWRGAGAWSLIGGVLAQLSGNALVEETVFRGFFFTQFRLRTQNLGYLGSLAVAATSSAMLFALSHIPNRLFVKSVPMDQLMVDQAQLVVAGVLFTLVFVLTRNLFATTGLHALANDPVPAVAADENTVKATYIILLCAVLLGYSLVRLFSTVGRDAAVQQQDEADAAPQRK